MRIAKKRQSFWCPPTNSCGSSGFPSPFGVLHFRTSGLPFGRIADNVDVRLRYDRNRIRCRVGVEVPKKEQVSVQVAITSRHGTLSPGAHEHITRKAEKLLTYFDRVTAINVTVDFSNDRIEVEILVDAEHRHDLVASESGDNVTAVFDAALHKMEHQVRKYKEKIQDHRRDPALNEIAEAAEQRRPEVNP